MLEKLAVATRTRMRYTQSHEKLFSLLDLTENTTMRLPDATLNQKVWELFTRLHLGGEQCVWWGANDGGILRRLPSIQPDRSSEVAAYPLPLEAWRRLTPSLRRKALMLGCWAAICWRLVQQGQVDMALCVLPELSAFSRPSTLLATQRCDSGETCERRLPTK